MIEPNLYSFVLLVIAILAPALLVAWRAQWRSRGLRLALWLGLVLIFFAGWVLLRPTDSAQVKSIADVDNAIGNGEPVVLELFSEY